MRCLLAILIAFLFAAAPAVAQEDAALETQLHELVASYQGKVALYATDLNSGKTIAIDADTPVPTASVIKLTVLFEALKQIEGGRVHLADRLTLTKADQMPGSGVLTLFDTPMTLTLKDALTLMIDLSDNTATNLAIDRLGLQNIDSRITWLGLHDTWLYKKVFQPPVGPVPSDQPKFGLGKTTAREMAEVIRRFAVCDLNAPGTAVAPTPQDRHVCGVAMSMLKNQFDRDDLPRYLSNLVVANKTGALDQVRNDVAVVYAANGPVIISAFTYDNKDQSWTADNSAQVLLAKIGGMIIDRWR